MEKKCCNCGEALPEEASFCMHCFTPLNTTSLGTNETPNKKSNKLTKYISAVLCITLFISTITIICFFNSKSGNDTTPSKSDAQTITVGLSTAKTSEEAKNTTLSNTNAKPSSTTKKTSTEKSTSQQAATDSTTKTTTTTTKKATTVKTTQEAKIVVSNGTLINYPANRTSSSYSIPYDVSKISSNAFNNNEHIRALKFSKRENIECNWSNLFSSLPNLETVYVYPGTSADLEGLQYFNGEIVYYD